MPITQMERDDTRLWLVTDRRLAPSGPELWGALEMSGLEDDEDNHKGYAITELERKTIMGLDVWVGRNFRAILACRFFAAVLSAADRINPTVGYGISPQDAVKELKLLLRSAKGD